MKSREQVVEQALKNGGLIGMHAPDFEIVNMTVSAGAVDDRVSIEVYDLGGATQAYYDLTFDQAEMLARVISSMASLAKFKATEASVVIQNVERRDDSPPQNPAD